MSATAPGRRDIEAAWRRAQLNGLSPSSLPGMVPVEVDPEGRLLTAAVPVLDALAEQLQGTRYCVVLADREANVLARRLGRPTLEGHLDDIQLVPGARFSEEVMGTTGIGTVLEVRRGIRVTGAEHFMESLRDFACYGHPITHPLTRRVEGILDITGLVADDNALVGPFVASAVREIEQRLLLGARASQQALLAAFQAACAQTRRPVLAIGDGMTLANPPASRELGPQDHEVLRVLGTSVSGQRLVDDLRLASGRLAVAEFTAVTAAGGGFLVHVSEPVTSTATTVPAAPWHRPAPTGTVVVRGEAGTGKTRWAREHAGLDAPVLAATDDAPWSAWRRVLAAAEGRPVVLDDLHLLPAGHQARLRRVLADGPHVPVVATTGTDATPGTELAALLATFDHVEVLPPLRDRMGELADIAASVLEDIEPGRGRTVGPDLLSVLLERPWPGNLPELRALLQGLAAECATPVVELRALPPERRRELTHRTRTPLEQAEYRAVVAALDACAGNKVQAARRLGISRATLYAKIRTFRIDG